MKKILAIAATALTLASSTPGLAQSAKDLGELKREMESLKAGQLAIQKDLADIKSMLLQREVQNLRDQLQARPAAQGAGSAPAAAPTAGAAQETLTVVSIDGGAVKGDANAKITLVEFTDYQCPFCSRHYRDTMPQIIKDYVDTGKVKYVLREFPLEAIHPLAFKASEAAQCAGEQGKYWEMHDRLFANQNALAQAQLLGHGEAIALDAAKFKSCLDGGKFAAKVRKDLGDAQKAGATGTPTFYLGRTDPGGREVKSVRKLVGAQPYASFKDAIDTLLAQN